ncbi:MAG TPA: hypothetical protein VGI81_14710 [Tepidisphaeraceae bacterium]|jgi:hypothetical protein
MPVWLRVIAIALGVAVGLLVLDRVALWMEARGWIYWRRVKPKGGGGVAAGLTAFQQLIEPQVRHVIEEREGRLAAERDRSSPGEGPDRS